MREFRTNTLFVNAYLCNQAFGGPEEGGWWFEYGEPLASVPVKLTTDYVVECEGIGEPDEEGYHDEYANPYWPDLNAVSDEDCERIGKVVDELRATFAHLDDPRGIGSVLCDGVVRVNTEFRFAKPFPEQRPHYE